MPEFLKLKWGTIKAWDLNTKPSIAALAKYHAAGPVSSGAITQHDNDAQKAAICELIDALDCENIYLGWAGEYVSKEKAKEYVLNYGKAGEAS